MMDMQQLATRARPQHSSSDPSKSMLSFADLGLRALVEVVSVYNEREKPEAMIAAGSIVLGREPCKSYPGWAVVSPWPENDGKFYDPEGEKKGWRQRNFVKFMAYIKDLFHTENMVLEAIDWKAEGEVTVVDVSIPRPDPHPDTNNHQLGGSAGHDDAVLATKFPNLKIVVQDLPEVAPVFEKEFPSELRSRVSFLTHNLFHPQPVQADIYMLKWILHDWPDVESVKILQALRPALRPGARVLFIDYVGKQEPSNEELPRSIQGFGTATDLRMMALFNAKERPVEAWKDIFKQADERYDVVRVEADPLSFMCVLEAVWRG